MRASTENIAYENSVRAKVEGTEPVALTFRLDIPVYDKNGVPTDFHYYEVDPTKVIGQGSFGIVYMGFPIDPTTDKPLYDKPVAVKVIDEQEFKISEYNIFKCYYRTEAPYKLNGQYYLVTEYFPGDDLFDRDDQLNPPFINLDFSTTLELIYQICLAINLLHHTTKSTGSAVVHGDIKGSNIRAQILKNGKIHVNIVDFGFTVNFESDPHKRITEDNKKGSPYYIPREYITSGLKGLKNDIFSLTPIILTLLGAENPFSAKEAAVDNDHVFYFSSYVTKGLLERFKADLQLIPYPAVKNLVELFISNMQSGYKFCPDSGQLLKFFTALNNSYKLAQENALKSHELKRAKNPLEQKEILKQIDSIKQLQKQQYCTLILNAFKFWQDHSDNYTAMLQTWHDDPVKVEMQHELCMKLETFSSMVYFQDQIIDAYHSGKLIPRKFEQILAETQEYLELQMKIRASLKEYKKYYSEFLLDQLNNLVELDTYAVLDFFKKLEQSPYDHDAIKLIARQLEIFKVELNLDTLRAMLRVEGLSFMPAVKLCLEAFIQRKTRESSFYNPLWSYSKGETLAAAHKLLTIFEGAQTALSPREQAVLTGCEIGGLLTQLKIFDQIKLSKPAQKP